MIQSVLAVTSIANMPKWRSRVWRVRQVRITCGTNALTVRKPPMKPKYFSMGSRGSGKREAGRGKREAGSGKREEGSGKREAGRGKRRSPWPVNCADFFAWRLW